MLSWKKPAKAQEGEMAEWLKAHAWKACLGETLTWVRIPLSPPALALKISGTSPEYFLSVLTFSVLGVLPRSMNSTLRPGFKVEQDIDVCLSLTRISVKCHTPQWL